MYTYTLDTKTQMHATRARLSILGLCSGGIHEDATILERAVHVRHHGADVASPQSRLATLEHANIHTRNTHTTHTQHTHTHTTA